MPKWSDFVSWIFFALLAYYAYSLTENVKKVSDSIAELNVRIAVVVEQIQTQRRDLEKLDGRVEKLEVKKVR